MSTFVFKRFTVKQEKSAMKIGTDSVLLGCLCETAGVRTILDIGTGTGILALMLAQRSDAVIDAVESDPGAAAEAASNFEASEWKHRLTLHHQTIQQHARACTVGYDLIISNPPYFKAGSNVPIEDVQRSSARHTGSLPFEELAAVVSRLLNPEGSFWLILPVPEARTFRKEAEASGLQCSRTVHIIPSEGQAANRHIMKFTKKECSCSESEFVVYDHLRQPSDAYKQVAREFYTGVQFQ